MAVYGKMSLDNLYGNALYSKFEIAELEISFLWRKDVPLITYS